MMEAAAVGAPLLVKFRSWSATNLVAFQSNPAGDVGQVYPT
ncbi:hypothetical protein [Mycobacterium aquaticum]|nr:hypothetical protein [Mycobacterium aquaticum]